MSYRVLGSLLLTMLMITPAIPAEPMDRGDDEPSIALLEYLGLLEQMEDELIGPELFDVEGTDDDDNPETVDDDSTINTDETPTKGGAKP